MGVCVVVPLDRGQVGVERQEHRSDQSLLDPIFQVSFLVKYLFSSPDTGWDCKVAQFVKHLSNCADSETNKACCGRPGGFFHMLDSEHTEACQCLHGKAPC